MGSKGRDLDSRKWFGSSGSRNAGRPGILETRDGELMKPGEICKREGKKEVGLRGTLNCISAR